MIASGFFIAPTNCGDPSGALVWLIGFEGTAGYQPDRTKDKGIDLGGGGPSKVRRFLDEYSNKANVKIVYLDQAGGTGGGILPTIKTDPFEGIKRGPEKLSDRDFRTLKCGPTFDRIVYIGWSWGASTALEWAKFYKGTVVDLLFLIDPVPGHPPATAWRGPKGGFKLDRPKDVVKAFSWFQQSDTINLAKLYGHGIWGSELVGADNQTQLIPAARFGAENLDANNGHVDIAGLSEIENAWKSEVNALLKNPTRHLYTAQELLELGNKG